SRRQLRAPGLPRPGGAGGRAAAGRRGNAEVGMSTASVAGRQRLRLGGVVADPVRFDEALETIAALVDAGEGGAVFTPNVDHVAIAETDERLRAAYSRVSLALADGMPVVWASRLLDVRLPEKV